VTDLVVMSLEAWDGVWRRNQHLISRLLEGDPDLRVLFVEPPADPLHDVRTHRRPQRGHRPRRRADLSPRLWTMQPVKALPRRIDPRADERIARSAAKAAAKLGMTDPVLWVNDPAAADVARLTGWPTLYDMTDDWAAAARSGRERSRILAGETYLLHHAAQVVACSPELLRRKSPARPTSLAPIVLIRNAVDAAAYDREWPRPADLPAGAVALYAGTLHGDRLDVELCVRTAQALDERATLVLVGPNALDAADTRSLADAGVILLGARPHEQIPAYLMHADVLLVPHLVDEFTDSLDPLKLYEYQAAGRPVLSTPVAGFRDADDARILVTDAAEFPAASTRAVSGPADEIVFRSAPDWSDRATALHAVLGDLTLS